MTWIATKSAVDKVNSTRKLVTQFGIRLYLRGLTQMKRSSRKSQTRILGLIQDFNSLSISVAIYSSLLAIYPWRDPFALQTNTWRDPLVYKSHISCNLSPISRYKSSLKHILSPARFIEHCVNTTNQSININPEINPKMQSAHSLSPGDYRTFLLQMNRWNRWGRWPDDQK